MRNSSGENKRVAGPAQFLSKKAFEQLIPDDFATMPGAVTLDAMTPGEMKAGGRGLTIRAGIADTHFGRCLAARTHRGICRLSFVEDEKDEEGEFAALEKEWPNADFVREDGVADKIVKIAFGRHASGHNIRLQKNSLNPRHGRRGEFHGIYKSMKFGGNRKPRFSVFEMKKSTEGLFQHPLLVRGTDFQVRVWRAILSIPPGRVASYEMVAAAVRSPRAARAVGEAMAKNLVAVLIPCHRVIRKSGDIGNYRGGTYRKEALLAWEADE